jgi:glycosyl transferase family 25
MLSHSDFRYINLMKSYIISLDKDEYRRSRIIENMRVQNFCCDYEVVAAVKGECLDTEFIDLAYDRQLFESIYGRQMGCKELACVLSHKSVYERILASSDNVAAIFEDDALLSLRLNAVIPKVVERLSCDQPGVIILSQPTQYHKSSLMDIGDGLHRLCRPECIYGAYGYVLNKPLASLLLNYNTPVFRCSDHWNEFQQDIDFDLMALVPHEVGNIDFDRSLSNLSLERDQMYEKAKSKIKEKKRSFLEYSRNLPRAVFRRIYTSFCNYVNGVVKCETKNNDDISLK